MTRGSADTPTSRATCGRKDAAAEGSLGILDALAVELGKLAAERDFAMMAAEEDKADPDGLSSRHGESVQ